MGFKEIFRGDGSKIGTTDLEKYSISVICRCKKCFLVTTVPMTNINSGSYGVNFELLHLICVSCGTADVQRSVVVFHNDNKNN